MSVPPGLTLAAALGGRSAHRALSRAFQQPFIDHLEGLHDAKRLAGEAHNARYYAWANFWRGALYIPVLVGLQSTGQWFSQGLISILVAFHAVCVGAETYKGESAKYLLRTGRVAAPGPALPPAPTPKPPTGYYAPKRFESVRAYQWLGFEWVRRIVNAFIVRAKLTPEERRHGVATQQMEPTRTGIRRYQAETCQAERMHLLAGALNLPPLASFLWLAKWRYAGYVGFILLIDASLVGLQRYLRVRLNARLAAKAERSKR